MNSGDTKTQSYLRIAATGSRSDLPTDNCCNTKTQNLILNVAERIITEEETRAAADAELQDEIDELRNSPDVVDIVATYAALQAYDTSRLTDKDIIRVLADETHDGASTYYRWSTDTETFAYIGKVGDYYTKAEVDTALAAKQDTLIPGSNIQINGNTISATDTTYSTFVGADGTNAGAAGLVPAPTATDNDKYLKGDGTWGVVQSGGSGIPELTSADYNYPSGSPDGVALWTKTEGVYVVKAGTKAYVTQNDVISSSRAEDTVVYISQKLDSVTRMILYHRYSQNHPDDQLWMALVGATGVAATDQPLIHWGNVTLSTGNSDAILMTQKATTSMVFADPADRWRVRIGANSISNDNSVAIGGFASAFTQGSVGIGRNAKAGNSSSGGYGQIAIGYESNSNNQAGAIALGAYSGGSPVIAAPGVMHIGTSQTAYGYNSSNYRLLTGLYDGQSNHDAATVAQGNKLMTAAPTATDAGVLGQLWTDTTNMHTYQLTTIDTTDPSSPVYTWTQRW